MTQSSTVAQLAVQHRRRNVVRRLDRPFYGGICGPGVSGLEKIYVELHLEADPTMTVHDSHDMAAATRLLFREKLDWVADLIDPIEPFTGGRRKQ